MTNQGFTSDHGPGEKFKKTQRVRYVPGDDDGKIPDPKPEERPSTKIPSPGRIEKQPETSKGSNRLERVEKEISTTRQKAKSILFSRSGTNAELLPPNHFDDLKDLPEGKEKENILKAIFKLMKDNQFENVSLEERAWKGCIFHVPKDIDELRQRVANSKMFLAMVRDEDKRVMGFTEFTGKRVYKLSKAGRIKFPHPRKIEAIMKYSEQDKVWHEQLIVADQSLQLKGIGSALLAKAFSIAEDKKIVMVTTEVQTNPPNNKSMTFHSQTIGYSDLGTIKERPNGRDEVTFVLYVRALTDDVGSELHGDTPTTTPTAV